MSFFQTSNCLKIIMPGLACSTWLPKMYMRYRQQQGWSLRIMKPARRILSFPSSVSTHPAPSSCPWRICHWAGGTHSEVCLLLAGLCVPPRGPQDPEWIGWVNHGECTHRKAKWPLPGSISMSVLAFRVKNTHPPSHPGTPNSPGTHQRRRKSILNLSNTQHTTTSLLGRSWIESCFVKIKIWSSLKGRK